MLCYNADFFFPFFHQLTGSSRWPPITTTCRTFLSVKPEDNWRTSSRDLSLDNTEKDSKCRIEMNVWQVTEFHPECRCVFVVIFMLKFVHEKSLVVLGLVSIGMDWSLQILLDER